MKGRDHIGGAVSRVGLISFPRIDTGEQGQARSRGGTFRGQGGRTEKEGRVLPGGYWFQGILVKLGCSLTLVSLM